MTLSVSTGLENILMGHLAAEIASGNWLIKIYGSPVSESAALALIPASAESALGTATLLCTVSVDGTGTGLTMDPTAVNGILSKSPTETWVGDTLASGFRSFYRFAPAADDGTASTTTKRMQGNVGLLFSDLVVSSVFKSLGDEQRVDSYVIGIP